MNDWIEDEFGSVSLGDQRLNQRLRLLLARKWEKPGASFSAACQGHKEVVAASRFLNNEKATQKKILGPHRTALLERIRAGQHPRVLLVQDTTECDYTSHKKLQGTGPLSSQDRRGFFAHNHLVITSERLPLGRWATAIDARDDAEHGKAAERKHRPIALKESFRWLEGYRRACALAAQVPGCQVVSLKQALKCVRWYCRRWRIEEWHRVLKSGCKIEAPQNHSAETLLRAITLDAVIVWRIMLLVLLGREVPGLPSDLIFSSNECEVLELLAKKKNLSRSEAIIVIAKLGGYLNQKCDAYPGYECLWKGYAQFRAMVQIVGLTRRRARDADD